MIFRRTAAGLSNQYLFLGVDTVVFVEGGRSYSKEEVYLDHFNSSSIDIKFWQGIFKYYSTGKKYEFRAIGSKSTLLEIAKDISSGVVKNVFVAMDRDHDKLNKRLINADGIFYTYGYSWENDVWHPDVIQKEYLSLCVDNVSAIKKEIRNFISAFEKDIYSSVCCDIHLSTLNSSFFLREVNAARFIKIKDNKEPCLNTTYINSLFQKAKINKSKMTRYGKRIKANISRDCYGHLWAEFCYRLIDFLLSKKNELPRIAKHYVNFFAINEFFNLFSSEQFKMLHKHYSKHFAAVA